MGVTSLGQFSVLVLSVWPKANTSAHGAGHSENVESRHILILLFSAKKIGVTPNSWRFDASIVGEHDSTPHLSLHPNVHTIHLSCPKWYWKLLLSLEFRMYSMHIGTQAHSRIFAGWYVHAILAIWGCSNVWFHIELAYPPLPISWYKAY